MNSYDLRNYYRCSNDDQSDELRPLCLDYPPKCCERQNDRYYSQRLPPYALPVDLVHLIVALHYTLRFRIRHFLENVIGMARRWEARI